MSFRDNYYDEDIAYLAEFDDDDDETFGEFDDDDDEAFGEFDDDDDDEAFGESLIERRRRRRGRRRPRSGIKKPRIRTRRRPRRDAVQAKKPLSGVINTSAGPAEIELPDDIANQNQIRLIQQQIEKLKTDTARNGKETVKLADAVHKAVKSTKRDVNAIESSLRKQQKKTKEKFEQIQQANLISAILPSEITGLELGGVVDGVTAVNGVERDQLSSMLPLLLMGGSGGGSGNNNMLLPLILLQQEDGNSSSDNSLLLVLALTMMNK